MVANPVVAGRRRAEIREIDDRQVLFLGIRLEILQILTPVQVRIREVAVAFARPANDLVEIGELVRRDAQ